MNKHLLTSQNRVFKSTLVEMSDSCNLCSLKAYNCSMLAQENHRLRKHILPLKAPNWVKTDLLTRRIEEYRDRGREQQTNSLE